jgi:hypothetical protein
MKLVSALFRQFGINFGLFDIAGSKYTVRKYRPYIGKIYPVNAI